GRVDVHRGEDALVGELPDQLELGVAGALELLEDDLVHAGPGVDQGGGEDGQRTAVIDVAGRTEEELLREQIRGVDTTGQDAAGGRGGEVVRTAQAGDRVEQHDDVVTQLHQALGTLDGELGDRGVVLGRAVEGRGDDLALDRPLHVGDLFRTLVDEDDHQVALGVVVGDRVGDRLHDHGLAGLRRGHDQTALALADRRHQVDDPRGQHAGVRLKAEAVLRVERGELVELRAAAAVFGGHAVDGVQADQRVELLAALALLGLAHGAGDVVALAQAVLADLGEGDVHVVRTGQVAGGPDEGVVVEDVQDARDGDQDVVLGDLRLGVVAATAATAVAVASAPATPAAALLLVAVVLTAAALLVLLAALAALAVAVPAAALAALAVGPRVGLGVGPRVGLRIGLGLGLPIRLAVALGLLSLLLPLLLGGGLGLLLGLGLGRDRLGGGRGARLGGGPVGAGRRRGRGRGGMGGVER